MPRSVWFPQFAMTMVRRVSATQAPNNFVFRVDPKMTKPEIKQYLERIYGVNVQRVATVNYEGKVRRSGQHRFKLNDYKKVYVRLGNSPAPAADGKATP